ncbi:MAG: hypothetical protein U5K81_03555 [Trueperaceae bacterium]|nr:hypothetical protein [Trueperaceae bacterium]
MHVDGALESVEEDVREVGAAAVAGGEVAGVPGEGWERAGDALPVCLVAGGAVAGVGVFAERFVPAGRLRVVFAVGRRLCVAFPFGRGFFAFSFVVRRCVVRLGFVGRGFVGVGEEGFAFVVLVLGGEVLVALVGDVVGGDGGMSLGVVVSLRV